MRRLWNASNQAPGFKFARTIKAIVLLAAANDNVEPEEPVSGVVGRGGTERGRGLWWGGRRGVLTKTCEKKQSTLL